MSPALEKHGKGCHLLLGRDKVYLIQTTLEADGMLIVAQLDTVSTLNLCLICFLSLSAMRCFLFTLSWLNWDLRPGRAL